jgi:hypothetical protein
MKMAACLRAKVTIFAANVYHLPQKGHQQDALFAGDKDELRGVEKDELSRVNKDRRPLSNFFLRRNVPARWAFRD